MFKKIAEKVWKFTGNSDRSNVYYLDLDKKTLIDTGNRADRQYLERDLKYMVQPGEIDTVIFTHLHYDHIGNFDMFPNAMFYASSEEIEELNKNKFNAILNKEVAEKFSIEPLPLGENINGLDVVMVPGHTSGSIALWHPATKMLFTGDTYFSMEAFGRTDLPTSKPEEMKKSVKIIEGIKGAKICPGHDY